ncbi:MAG TPA: methyltransferase domain-containing protein [Chitinophagaceae bacterium]|nr:methyltransferase domain-containing protein [Chitinophagaceae bacterium]
MAEEYLYPGSELHLFEKAVNWKTYFAAKLIPHIKGDVLECGAGIGSNAAFLNNGMATTWVMLEPDANMAACLNSKLTNKELPANTEIFKGTIQDLIPDRKFDVIIYIDVLEHIEHDALEITTAAKHLKTGGQLIVLAPAFQFLYNSFDKAIGHYRRYTAGHLKNLAPSSLQPRQVIYLDSMGFFASAANRLLLNQSLPSIQQIQFWDKYLIPVSRLTDRVFFFSFGKSILAIWKKQ